MRRDPGQPHSAGTIVRFGSIVPVDSMLKTSPEGDRNYLRIDVVMRNRVEIAVVFFALAAAIVHSLLRNQLMPVD